jgi:mannose-6-phosphate isomerase-like protein (cupin superfamily)
MQLGTVLDIRALGVRVEVRRTGTETDGELVEFDVVGCARGFITQAHVHARQRERHEVVEGRLRLVVDGREHVLGPGEAMEVPPGAPHRQLPGDEREGRVRVQLRPAGRTLEFLERLAVLSAEGGLNRWGYPRPLAAAALVRDFGDEGTRRGPRSPCSARSPRRCWARPPRARSRRAAPAGTDRPWTCAGARRG